MVQLFLHDALFNKQMDLDWLYTYSIPRASVSWTLCCSRPTPSSPLPLPSRPAHWPAPPFSQSIFAVLAHFRATSGVPILPAPWKFWQWTKDHHALGSVYLATQSCCTLPAHWKRDYYKQYDDDDGEGCKLTSSGPWRHFTPKSGSEESILLKGLKKHETVDEKWHGLCNVCQCQVNFIHDLRQNLIEDVFTGITVENLLREMNPWTQTKWVHQGICSSRQGSLGPWHRRLEAAGHYPARPVKVRVVVPKPVQTQVAPARVHEITRSW